MVARLFLLLVLSTAVRAQSPTPSMVPFPYSYDSGNVILSRVERLAADLSSAATCGAACLNPSELARVWLDEITWPVAASSSSYCWVQSCADKRTLITALDVPFTAYTASRVQSMHFPHRGTSIDTYRLVLPYDVSDTLGLGQLSSSSDRCAVTIAGLDMPYYDGSDAHKQFSSAAYSSATASDTACSAHATSTFSGTATAKSNYITDIVPRIMGSSYTNYATRPNPCPIGSTVSGPGVPLGTYVTRAVGPENALGLVVNCPTDTASTGGTCFTLFLSNFITTSTATASCAQCFACTSPIVNFRASFEVTSVTAPSLKALTGDLPFLGMPATASTLYTSAATPQQAYFLTGPGIYPGTRITGASAWVNPTGTAAGYSTLSLDASEGNTALVTSTATSSSMFSAYATSTCSNTGFILVATATSTATPVFASGTAHGMAVGSSFYFTTSNFNGYTGIAPATPYYVAAVPSANTFLATASSAASTLTASAVATGTVTTSATHFLNVGDWFIFESIGTGSITAGVRFGTPYVVLTVVSSTEFTFSTSSTSTALFSMFSGVSIAPILYYVNSAAAGATVMPSCTCTAQTAITLAPLGSPASSVSTSTSHGLAVGSLFYFTSGSSPLLLGTLYTVTVALSRFAFTFAVSGSTTAVSIESGSPVLQTYCRATIPLPTYLTTSSTVALQSLGGNTLSSPTLTPAVLDSASAFFLFTNSIVTPCTVCAAVTLTYTQASAHQGNSGLANTGASQTTPIGSTSPYQLGVGASRARYPYAASCAIQYKNYGAAGRTPMPPPPLRGRPRQPLPT